MSHNLTPAPLSPGVGAVGVQVPDAGDARTAASVTTPIQQLLNMISWLYNALQGGFALNVFINGTLTSTGAIASGAASSISSGLDVNAARSINAAQDVVASGFVVAGNATIVHNITAGGSVSVTGDVLVGSSLDVSGVSTFHNVASLVGAARVVRLPVYIAGVAGMSASVQTASKYIFPSCATGATIQISDTGAVNGDTLLFVNIDTVHQLVIKDPSGATLGGLQHQDAEMTRIGGVWTYTGGHLLG